MNSLTNSEYFGMIQITKYSKNQRWSTFYILWYFSSFSRWSARIKLHYLKIFSRSFFGCGIDSSTSRASKNSKGCHDIHFPKKCIQINLCHQQSLPALLKIFTKRPQFSGRMDQVFARNIVPQLSGFALSSLETTLKNWRNPESPRYLAIFRVVFIM